MFCLTQLNTELKVQKELFLNKKNIELDFSLRIIGKCFIHYCPRSERAKILMEERCGFYVKEGIGGYVDIMNLTYKYITELNK